MGGFILLRNNFNQSNFNKTLELFKQKKQRISKVVNFLDYKLVTFNKSSFDNKNLFCFDNKDFIALLGTPIYKGQTFEKAAKELYNDFKKNADLDFTKFKGHFCCIIFIENKLFLFNDYNGVYHVYHD